MPVLLSLAQAGDSLYAAGADGLFRIQPDGSLMAEPQPMESLYCCAAVESLNGPLLLAGGSPHGTAVREPSGAWQAGWMDYTTEPVLQIAPAPDAAQTGVALAASGGAGILRTTNRGRTWTLVNYGLREFVVLALAWAPLPPAGQWPAREIVFAGSDRGLYRSPAGGLGWKPVEGISDAVQAIAVSPHFHFDGLVLAGTESAGLWRSADGGRSFDRWHGVGERIDALLAARQGWYAGTPDGIWFAADGASWQPILGSPGALCFLDTPQGVIAGGNFGVVTLAAQESAAP